MDLNKNKKFFKLWLLQNKKHNKFYASKLSKLSHLSKIKKYHNVINDENGKKYQFGQKMVENCPFILKNWNSTSMLDVYALTYLQNKPKILHESITHRYHLYL